MLLTNPVEESRNVTYRNEPSSAEWQDYLDAQTSAHPFFRRRHIAVMGGHGQVVLTGTVTSYYEKQLAQEYVRRVEGVQHIDNRINVAYMDHEPS